MTPNTGPTAGGTSVTITGTNFTGATAVTFGGTAATSFTVNSATSITAVTPAHAAGAVNVQVTTPGGTGTGVALFTYIAAPTVILVSPNTGPTAGGTSVTITGTNFTGATAVTFGGTAATSFTVNSATSITASRHAGACGGAVNVQVTTPGGTGTGSRLFTYVLPAPTVTTVSPNTGPTAGGTSVTITGTNFTGATAVTFGGTAATSFTVNSATSITAITPAHAAGAVNVQVTTPGGTGTGASLFTYVRRPDGDIGVAEHRADGRRHQRHHHGDQPHRRHGGDLRRDRGHKLHCEQCNLDHRHHASACGRCSECAGDDAGRHRDRDSLFTYVRRCPR